MTRKRKTKAHPGRQEWGRYIGLIRNLPLRLKAQARRIKQKGGRANAIRFMQKVWKKRRAA